MRTKVTDQKAGLAMGHEASWLPQIQAIDHLSAEQYLAMTAWIDPQRAGTILDLGCGPGGLLPYLADAAPSAHIIAVDHDDDALDAARSLVTSLDLTDQVLVEHGDALDPATQAGPFDIVIARQMAHHLPDQVEGLRALGARLSRRGRLILGEGGLSTHYLPFEIGHGIPGLMSRLVAANAIRFSGMRAELDHPVASRYGWNVVIDEAGLVVEATKSFLWDIPAPVSDDARVHIRAALSRFLGADVRQYLCAEDIGSLEWLLDAGNPDGVDHRRDLFILGASTLYRCARPADQAL